MKSEISRVLIAPDSFKGSAMSTEISQWIAEGWRAVRPGDDIIIRPMADGGEGTLIAIEQSRQDLTRITQSVMGPDNRSHNAFWFLTDAGTAFVELANICGLTHLARLDPMGAHTFGLGQVLYDIARDDDVKQVVIALGGSGSTDAGTGALRALGFRFLDSTGRDVLLGGRGLASIAEVEDSAAIEPPIGGVICLLDVDNPLIGERGSATTFAPQKGATPEEVADLESGLRQFLEVVGHEDSAGAGAAGGTAYGLQALWGARFTRGARVIAQIIGLQEEMAKADLIITGEGAFDEQSFGGKVVGTLFELLAENRAKNAGSTNGGDPVGRRDPLLAVIAGILRLSAPHIELLKSEGLFAAISLSDRAASVEAAIRHVRTLTVNAGSELARSFTATKLAP